jgi:formylglycine-generating enzyme required for sulfatase activity
VDALCGDLSSAILITSADINVSDVGNQVVTYSVSDAGGNTNTATRTVIIKDTTDPVLTLLAHLTMTHVKDTIWVDPGATASDSLDGNLSSSIAVSGTVDVNTTGTYILSYTVSDAAGNEASISRTVNIIERPASTHTADLNASVSLEMIWVDPGTFMMGSPTTEVGRNTNETQHEVTLTQGFYLGKYEVTQAQYEAVMTGNTDGWSAKPSGWGGVGLNYPVEKGHSGKFLTRLNEQEAGNIPAGWAYVLPTEAQWEYACRAGTTTAYSWGDTITTNNANYGNNRDFRDVGQYSANPWGFFDMHGNAWEWTVDAWGNYVARGGSFYDAGQYLRSAQRNSGFSPGTPGDSYGYGFRVSLQLQ